MEVNMTGKTVKETAITTTTTKEVSFADKLLNPTPDVIDPIALINDIATTNETNATKLANFFKEVRGQTASAQSGAGTYAPARLMVNNGKGDNAPEDSIKGDFFNNTTKEIIKPPMLMFPVFSHAEYTKWGTGDKQGQTLAKSIDGKRFKNVETGEYFDVEELPVKPGRWVKKADSGYEYSEKIYFVDKDFTNMFTLISKSYGLATCHDKLINLTKANGDCYSPESGKWISLGVSDQKHNFGTSKLFNASLSDTDVTEDEAKMIMFFKQCAREYYNTQLTNRDADEAQMAEKLKDLENLENAYETTTGNPAQGEKKEDINQTFESI